MPGLRKPDPRINAGDLDRRVTLLKPIYNDWSDEIVDWQAVITVWASIEPIQSLEMGEALSTIANTDMTIRIRYRDDVDARWRIRHRNFVYQVRGLMNVIARREQLELACRLVL